MCGLFTPVKILRFLFFQNYDNSHTPKGLAAPALSFLSLAFLSHTGISSLSHLKEHKDTAALLLLAAVHPIGLFDGCTRRCSPAEGGG